MSTVTRKHIAEIYDHALMVTYHENLTNRYGLLKHEQGLINRYLIAPATVLVLGCGTGRELFPLHQQGFTGVGLDISWNMLQTARKCLATQNLNGSHISLQQGDAVSLPYREACFDHVLMISQMFQHIPKRRCRQQALREIYRVLKPGGYCIFSAFNGSISYLYLLLILRQQRHLFYTPSQPEQSIHTTRQTLAHVFRRVHALLCPSGSYKPHWLKRGAGKILNRIVWELDPTVWSYSDPLPLGMRLAFACSSTLANGYRRVRNAIVSSPNRLEPGDIMIDFPDFTLHSNLGKGNLFMHFPEMNDLLDDIRFAGFTVTDYRSLEELQQHCEFSEQKRRLQRLIFYIVHK